MTSSKNNTFVAVNLKRKKGIFKSIIAVFVAKVEPEAEFAITCPIPVTADITWANIAAAVDTDSTIGLEAWIVLRLNKLKGHRAFKSHSSLNRIVVAVGAVRNPHSSTVVAANDGHYAIWLVECILFIAD